MIGKTCLWEVYLEEFSSVDPNAFKRTIENAYKISQLTRKLNIPIVRLAEYIIDENMSLDERGYYAIITYSIKKFIGTNERDVVSSLKKGGIEKTIVVGGLASSCVKKVIKYYLIEDFNVIVPTDAIVDIYKSKVKITLEEFRDLGCETPSTKELLKTLKKPIDPVHKATYSSRLSQLSATLFPSKRHALT